MATSLWGLRQTEDEEQHNREAMAAFIGTAAETRNSLKDKSADEIADVDSGVELDQDGADEIADLDSGVELDGGGGEPEVDLPEDAKDETPNMGVGEHARMVVRQETGKRADQILNGGNDLYTKTMDLFGVSREGSASALIHAAPFVRNIAKIEASREEKALEKLRTGEYNPDDLMELLGEGGLVKAGMNVGALIPEIGLLPNSSPAIRERVAEMATEELRRRTGVREEASGELNRREQTTWGKIAGGTLENSGYVAGYIYGSTIAGGLGIGIKATEGAGKLAQIGVSVFNGAIGSVPQTLVGWDERYQRLNKKDYKLGDDGELQVIDNNYDAVSSAIKGGIGSFVENTVVEGMTDAAIELACLGLGKIPGAQAFIVKPLQKLGNAAVRKMMGNKAGRALLRVGKAYNSISQFTHFNSQPVEMLEEDLQPIFDNVFGLDKKRGEWGKNNETKEMGDGLWEGFKNELGNYNREVLTLANQKDIFYGLVGTCLLQAGAGGAGAAWARRSSPGGMTDKEATSVLTDYANVPVEKVKTLSSEEKIQLAELYRVMSANPDKMVEFAERLGAKSSEIIDGIVSREGAKMNRQLEAAGMSPTTFKIPMREENGKQVPDFQFTIGKDMVTGKTYKGRAVTDAESGVMIMDNGSGVGTERAYTVVDSVTDQTVDVPNLMLAQKTASFFKNRGAMIQRDRAAKQQYINNVWEDRYGNAKIEQYDTVQQAIAASQRHGVDITAQEGFNPGRPAWHLNDGTIIFVRDNINSPYEVDTLFQHEIVGHNADAMADEFMDNLDSKSMREAQKALNLTDEQMADPRTRREVFANLIQQRRHNPSFMQKFKHFINERRRAAGDGTAFSDADIEALAQKWEEAARGDSGSMKSESAESGMEFLDADGNPVGVEDADIEVEEENADETGTGADEAQAQPAEGAERPAEPETPRPAEGAEAGGETDETVKKPVASRTVIEKMTEQAPVQELDTAEVFNDDTRIPNFKEGANPETGEVEPLQGEPYDLVSNPIVVMEFKDGKKVVVTGRHRLALYKRAGREKIAARVIREADGWTVNDAKMIDSIGNIIDEKGSVKDYVKYFEDARPSREAAEAGGFLARPKGKLAFGIYEGATEDTRSSIDWEGGGADGMISVEQAGIIAESAPRNGHPRNKALQRILVRRALDGLRGKKLGILARSLAEEVKNQKEPTAGGGEMQLDLFSSAEDQELLAMEEKRADYRTKKAQEYGRIAEVLRTAMAKGGKLDLNDEYARELGITDPKDKKQLAAARDKAVERANYWENAVRLDEADKTAMDAEIGASAQKTAQKKNEVSERLKTIKEGKKKPTQKAEKPAPTPEPAKTTPVSAPQKAEATTPPKAEKPVEGRKSSDTSASNGFVTQKQVDAFAGWRLNNPNAKVHSVFLRNDGTVSFGYEDGSGVARSAYLFADGERSNATPVHIAWKDFDEIHGKNAVRIDESALGTPKADSETKTPKTGTPAPKTGTPAVRESRTTEKPATSQESRQVATPRKKTVVLKDAERAKAAQSQANDLMNLFATPELDTRQMTGKLDNEEKFRAWAKKWKLDPSKEKYQREWAKKNGVMFASPEFDPEKFQQRVGAMAKLVSTLNQEGFNDFNSVASYLSENFPKDRFDAAKPYLRSVWNAVADAMGLEEVSKKDAETVYTAIEKSYNTPASEESNNGNLQESGRSDDGQPSSPSGIPSEGNDGGTQGQGTGQNAVQTGESSTGATVLHDGTEGHVLHVERPEVADGAVPAGRAEGVGESAEGSPSVAQHDGRGNNADNVGTSGKQAGVALEPGRSGGVEPGGRGRVPGEDGQSVAAPVRAALNEQAPNAVKNENYIITDADERAIEGGKPKDKVRANIEAIRIVRKLAEDGRDATPEEKTALARYVGWGGLKPAFNNTYYNAYEREQSEGTLPPQTWAAIRKTPLGEEGYDLYKQIRELLSQEEINSIEESTTSAFFTPIRLCRSIHKALASAGLTGGRFIETSAGIGNFIGTGNYANPRWTAVELDKVTGQILKALYPKANVRIQGFEDVIMPDNFMDAAISNVPFGTNHPFDPNYKKYGFLVHDFFFAKAIDKIHPGGVAALITATGTLDKRDKSLIRYLSEHGGKIVGAVRIHNGFFAKNAGTNVATDVVFIQKVEGKADNSVFLETPEYKGCPVSRYFLDHPEFCMGKMVPGTNQFGQPELSYKAEDDDYSKIDEAVQKAASELKFTPVNELQQPKAVLDVDTHGLKIGNVGVVDGKIVRREAEGVVEVPKSQIKGVTQPLMKRGVTPQKIVQKICELRDAMQKVIDAQMNDCTDEELAKLQKDLNFAYDFIKRNYGAIHSRLVSQFVELDWAASPLLSGLENPIQEPNGVDKNGNPKFKTVGWEKNDIFTKRVIAGRASSPSSAGSALDGLRISLNETGTVNTARIAELTGKSEEDVKKELIDTGLVFVNPETSGIETRDEYLSGSVRKKLKAAQAAAAGDPRILERVKLIKEIEKEQMAFDTQAKALDRSQMKVRVAERDLMEAEKRTAQEREAIDRYNAAKGDSPFTLMTAEDEPKALTDNTELARYIQDKLGFFARKGSSDGYVGTLFGFGVRYERGEGTDRGAYMTIKELGVKFPVTVLPGTGAAFPSSDLSKFKTAVTTSTNQKYRASLDSYVDSFRKRLEVARKGVENAAGFDSDAASAKIGDMNLHLAHLNRALGIKDQNVRDIAAGYLREQRGREAGNVAAAIAAAAPVEDNSVFADVPAEARLRVAEQQMAEADFASPEFDPRNANTLREISDIIVNQSPEVAAKQISNILQEAKDGRRRIRPYSASELVRGTQGRNHALGVLALVARATGESLGRDAYGSPIPIGPQTEIVPETRQRNALTKVAKGLGVYIEPSEILSILSSPEGFLGRGQYSIVYERGNDVLKIREIQVIAEDSESHVEGGATWDLDDILLSNAVLGEGFDTTLVGVTESNGRFYLVLSQPKADSIPTDRNVIPRLRDYMSSKGLAPDETSRDLFGNDDYEVSDLRLGANVGMRNGEIFPFDPITAFTSDRRKREGVLFATPELDPAARRLGIAKADLERQSRNLGRVPWRPKKRTWAEVYQRSEAALNQSGFIEELVADAARYARPLSAEHTVAVGQHLLVLGKQYEEIRALRQDVEHSIVEATRDNATTEDLNELGETLKQVKREESEVAKRYATAYKAMRMSKAQQGLALAANKAQFSEEFDFLGMKESRQSALGRDLTPEEMRQLHEICDRARDLDEDARAELWAAVHAQAERTIKDLFMKDSVKRSGDSRKKKLTDYRKKYLDAMAHLKIYRDTVGGSLVGITGDEYGTWNRPLFDMLLWHRFQNPDITAAEALQKVTEDVNTYITADETTVARILTGFERSWDINRHDEVLKGGRDLRSQILTDLQIGKLLNKEMPGKTGPMPGEPSAELREKRHTRDVLKSELEDETNDPRKLQSRQKRWMKWYDHRIEDLKREIAAGERLPQTKRTLAWTEEMKQKRAEYEELVKERDRVCGKSGLSEEERIKRYEAQLERTLRRATERLLAARNDDFRKPDRPAAVTSAYIEELQKAIEETHREWLQEKKDRLMFGRTQAEINKFNDQREKTRERRVAYWQALTAPNADRSVVKKPQIPMPPEQQARYEALGQQMKKLRRQVMDMRAHDELMKKPWFWRNGVEYVRFINGLTRGFLATADHSAVLRQMAQLSLAHPVLAARVFKNTIGTAFSDEKAMRINAELLSDPRIKEAVDKGWLNWRNLEAEGNSGDVEMFSSQHSTAITIGRNADGTEKRLALDDIKGVGAVLRGSERIYASYINALSAEIYLALTNADSFTARLMFGQNGLTDYTKKEIAARINMANGSMQVDKSDNKQFLQKLTMVFWAPKLALSRLQLAVGWDVIHPLLDSSVDVKTRLRTAGFNAIEHARAKLAMIALGTLMLMLAGNDDDKEKMRRASMFQKFLQVIKPRIGNTTLDFSGSEVGWYQLMAKWVTGTKETQSGKKVKLEGLMGKTYETFRFAQGKFNPLLANVIAKAEGRDFVGKPFGWGELAKNTFLPLGASDVVSAFAENGLGRGLLLAPFITFGAGGNTYPLKRYEVAANQFTEVAKSYDAVRDDRELSDDERSDMLEELEGDFPELKERGRIEGKIKNVKFFESEIRKMQKLGAPVPKSLTDGLERAKNEALEYIREARK